MPCAPVRRTKLLATSLMVTSSSGSGAIPLARPQVRDTSNPMMNHRSTEGHVTDLPTGASVHVDLRPSNGSTAPAEPHVSAGRRRFPSQDGEHHIARWAPARPAGTKLAESPSSRAEPADPWPTGRIDQQPAARRIPRPGTLRSALPASPELGLQEEDQRWNEDGEAFTDSTAQPVPPG